MNSRWIGVTIGLPGFAMATASLFLDNYLQANGISCQSVFTGPVCLGSAFLFWTGCILIGAGLVATLFWRVFARKWEPLRPRVAKSPPKSRFRAFLRWWVTPPARFDYSRQHPIKISVNIPFYFGALLFLYWWLAFEVPRPTVTGDSLFWLVLLAPLPWPLIIEILTRDEPILQEIRFMRDYAIAYGLVVIVLTILLHNRGGSLNASLLGLLPGFIGGALLGATFQILYRHYRGHGLTW